MSMDTERGMSVWADLEIHHITFLEDPFFSLFVNKVFHSFLCFLQILLGELGPC